MLRAMMPAKVSGHVTTSGSGSVCTLRCGMRGILTPGCLNAPDLESYLRFGAECSDAFLINGNKRPSATRVKRGGGGLTDCWSCDAAVSA